MSEIQAHDREQRFVGVEIEETPDSAQPSPPESPKCSISFEQGQAIVRCGSSQDLDLAKTLLKNTPVKLELRAETEDSGESLDNKPEAPDTQ